MQGGKHRRSNKPLAWYDNAFNDYQENNDRQRNPYYGPMTREETEREDQYRNSQYGAGQNFNDYQDYQYDYHSYGGNRRYQPSNYYDKQDKYDRYDQRERYEPRDKRERYQYKYDKYGNKINGGNHQPQHKNLNGNRQQELERKQDEWRRYLDQQSRQMRNGSRRDDYDRY